MTALTTVAAFAALAIGAPAALADPILDSSVVRRIEQADQRIRIAIDLDRKVVEDYLRTAVTEALQDYPEVTVDRMTLRAAGRSALGIDVDFTTNVQVGPLSMNASGTLRSRLVVSVSDASSVHGEVVLDSIEIPRAGISITTGTTIAGSSRRFQIPRAIGALDAIALESVDPAWIAVTIVVRPAAVPAKPSP
jgi:hypothetical protein